MFKFNRKKYYTPKLEEFIKGFEYEVYSEGYYDGSIEDFCGWYPYIFGVNNWRDLSDIKRILETNPEFIRVRIK